MKRQALALFFALGLLLGSSGADASVEIERCASRLAALTDSTLPGRERPDEIVLTGPYAPATPL